VGQVPFDKSGPPNPTVHSIPHTKLAAVRSHPLTLEKRSLNLEPGNEEPFDAAVITRPGAVENCVEFYIWLAAQIGFSIWTLWCITSLDTPIYEGERVT
jgi:hypothetical protein